MVSSCLESASEHHFSKDLVGHISCFTTLNYLMNEINIRVLMFPLDAFTLPFEMNTLCPNLFGASLNCEV